MSRELLDRTGKRMKASLESTRHDLAVIRTGRASLALLDGVHVEYYGTPTPLNQVAKLSIPEPTMITAHPFDPSIIREIENGIRKADLGLNPSNDGKIVRIPIPPLTEERRKQLARKAHQVAEEGRTAVRQIRRDANEEIRKLEKNKDLSQDDSHRLQEDVQKLTDKYIGDIDEMLRKKESDILEV
jgi:ribosome recycling factor